MKTHWLVAWSIGFTIIIGLLALGVLSLVSSQPRGQPISLSPPPTPFPLIVHVSGAVTIPGVYTLPIGSRVKDAIQAAGGLLPYADSFNLNMAAPLQDGELIWVPSIQQANPTAVTPEKTPNDNKAQPSTPVPTGLININTATLEELDTLPGIGPVKAQSIIDYRNSNGPFNSIKAIQDVNGIGPVTYEGLKELITVQASR
jgi:competence protein ComEA